jgi:hypothetical protein
MPARALVGAEVLLKVDVDGTGNVSRPIVDPAQLEILEIPAAIGDPQIGLVEAGCQVAGGDEWMFRHAVR